MRIAIAGFQHETNTLVASPTSLQDFEQADSWPALLSGHQVLAVTRGMNLPIAGFVKAASEDDAVDLLPILWCSAEPGGRVTDHAYESICTRILKALDQIGHVDAVYLDLHGAMVTQSFEDGEGELLNRLRAFLGPTVPLVASLDLHANITQQMVNASDTLTIYRTYPHIDMAATGARTYQKLRAIAQNGPPSKAFRQGEYLIPLHAQYTGAGPARALYNELTAFDSPERQFADLALGFTASDIADAGASIVAYADSESESERIADHLAQQLVEAEPHFDCTLIDADTAAAQAIAFAGKGPVVIADVQDNPGAGAASDTTGLLRALIRQNTPNTILGLIHDPRLAEQAHQTAKNVVFKALIGGRSPGDTPLTAHVSVHHLSNGSFPYTGEMYSGGIATLGRSAALKLEGTDIYIIVTSIRNQCLDLAHFRHFDLTPESARIICVKSTAHFRADFEPIAQSVLLAAAPGQFPCILNEIPYSNLRACIRLGPCGPTMEKVERKPHGSDT